MKHETDTFTRAMFGIHAIHTPMNFIVQAYEEDGAIIAIAQAKVDDALFKRLTFGSRLTHQLILGDIVLRPHLVSESDHLRGSGLAGLARSGFQMDDWVEHGRVLLHNS